MTTFTIHGKPVAKERPRSSKNGHFYTPQKTKDFETLVAWSYKAVSNKKYEDAVAVEIDFFRKKPKVCKRLFPITRTGDIDNQIKSILDGLNKVAYSDDCQVIDLVVRKRYSDKDYTVVKIGEVNK